MTECRRCDHTRADHPRQMRCTAPGCSCSRYSTDPDQVSAHFHLRELAVSASRPDLVQPVPQKYRRHAERLLRDVLEPIRLHVGRPVRILSSYRSPALNAAVGGSATSQHVRAEAADLSTANLRRLFEDLLEGKLVIPAGQVIFYPAKSFVHVALPSPRFPRPSFQLHWPQQEHRYFALTGGAEQLRHLLG